MVTPDPCKAMREVTAVQVFFDDLSNSRPPEPVFPFIPLIIYLYKLLKVISDALIEWRFLQESEDGIFGWSMISGCSYLAGSSVASGIAGSSVASGIIRAVIKFRDKYEFLGPGVNLEPSRGYWINLSEQADLTVHSE